MPLNGFSQIYCTIYSLVSNLAGLSLTRAATNSGIFSLDTFASKVAAIQDDTADASVGNVTGSNAVNVFLGIGIAWSMAAIYWTAQGEEFVVPVGR